MQSREYSECEGTESRGNAECTMRAKSECRGKRAEARVQSQECSECENAESNGGSRVHVESIVRGKESGCRGENAESAESRVQRVREFRVERREQSAQ